MTGEHLAPDVQELLRLLFKHKVRYLIAGGEAVIHHGYPRLTGDIDLFFDRSAVNARRLYAALQEFWGGEVPAVESADDLCQPDIVIQFGRTPNRVDLLNNLVAVQFSTAWRHRVVESLAPGRGRRFPVYFIGLGELLANKRRAGRFKDLDDVEHLAPRRRKK